MVLFAKGCTSVNLVDEVLKLIDSR